jgi:putative ABC transport system ATP-binding protein
MKNKFLEKFLNKTAELDMSLFDSNVIKVDFKTKKEILKANNRKRSGKNNPDKTMVNEEGNIIDIKDLNKYYISGGNSTQVLTNLNLSIKKGEFVVLFGKSGSGKTTLLNLISGLDRPTTGNLIVCDKNLPFLSNNQLTTFRRDNLSFIFQSYNLLNNLSGYDNVETGSYLQKDKNKKHLEFIISILSKSKQKIKAQVFLGKNKSSARIMKTKKGFNVVLEKLTKKQTETLENIIKQFLNDE